MTTDVTGALRQTGLFRSVPPQDLQAVITASRINVMGAGLGEFVPGPSGEISVRRGGLGRTMGRVGFGAGPVTLLFTNVEGSARLWEADREAMAEMSARHNRLVREQIEAAGGQVFRPWARRFVPCSPARPPRLRRRWLSSGLSGVSRGRPARWSGVRVALHSGPCVERDGDYVGPVVNRAARLLAAGHGGQILVSAATYELLAGRLPGGIGLADLGEHRLKDLGRAERAKIIPSSGPPLRVLCATCSAVMTITKTTPRRSRLRWRTRPA
jgi:class 3 adenylate cyclase